MDFKFLKSILLSESDIEGIPDSEYAEELQVQEVLEASMADLQISHYYQKDSPSSSRTGGRQGESSWKDCQICMELKGRNEMFKLASCSHTFCSDCVANHIQAKIEDNTHFIKCPICPYIIEPNSCRGIIPEDVFAQWEKAINEATILESQKFYCPFQDCSNLLLVSDDQEEGEIEISIIRESECPYCRRLFCAKCRVPWHSGLECEEFQKLKVDERGSDDLKLHNLAKENNWTKCPHCKYLVDKSEGCIHMTCRCGFEFCYICGSSWSEEHWSCQE